MFYFSRTGKEEEGWNVGDFHFYLKMDEEQTLASVKNCEETLEIFLRTNVRSVPPVHRRGSTPVLIRVPGYPQKDLRLETGVCPRKDLGLETSTPIRDLRPEIRTSPLWTDRHLSKHYLLVVLRSKTVTSNSFIHIPKATSKNRNSL